MLRRRRSSSHQGCLPNLRDVKMIGAVAPADGAELRVIPQYPDKLLSQFNRISVIEFFSLIELFMTATRGIGPQPKYPVQPGESLSKGVGYTQLTIKYAGNASVAQST